MATIYQLNQAMREASDLVHMAYAKGIKRLGLVCLGGSHAYGLETEDSNIDLRGFAFPTTSSILLGRDFEQIQSQADADICIYSLGKVVKLLAENNPNIIELLGLDKAHVFVTSPCFEEINNHPEWFLSKRAAHTFGGYATAQLRRLQNAMARDADAEHLARGALRSMQATLDALPAQYPHLSDTATFSLDLTDEDKPQVRVTMTAENAPATELASFARELDSARKSAETIGKNRRKDSAKLAKHASHLIRLLHMGTEILSGEGVHTNRQGIDADLLLDIKSGKWLDEDENGVRVYDDAFWDLLHESQQVFDYAEKNTELPDKADTQRLDSFLIDQYTSLLHETVAEGL